MSAPKYSLIIPTYNRAAFIKTTIGSALDQLYDNIEIIVVDDGSKDDTEAVVKSINDPKVHYYKKENGERGAARNFGVLKASGEYVTFLDSDDQLYDMHFSKAEEMVARYDHPDMFRLAYEYRDVNGNVLSTKTHQGDINKALVSGNLLSCIGVFIKREILLEVKFSENRVLSGTEDWLLWLRLAARYKIYGDNTITAVMIDHDSRSVMNYDEQEMLTRTNLLMEGLRSDKVFMSNMGQYLNKIEAHMYTYIALHLLLSNNKSKAWSYISKAGRLSASELFTKRVLVVIYKILFS